MSFSNGDLHNNKSSKVKWYNKKWFMWCMLFFFWPVGAYLLYRHRNEYSSRKIKLIAAGMCCYWLFLSFGSPKDNPSSIQPAAQAVETTAVSSSTDSEPAEDKQTENTQDTPKNETDSAQDASAQAATAPAATPSASTARTSQKTSSVNSFNTEASYLGNPKSMKFHRPSCRTIKHPERFVSLDSRDEAIASGYKPCGVCNP
ncbi:hypothetical protein [uncultured Mitsuokella sp.]|uniref:hypothetical protein n=1 Tax=uncultured Mitsuokella sp. TaxID=453120 RepID=UPI00266FC766|nr:hypothetical protein [uncultured Mitsuokella sp.]